MPAAQFVGMAELRRELRKLDDPKAWSLTPVHREVAKSTAGWAQREAQGMGGEQAHFAKAIRGYASQQAARIGIGSAGKGQRYAGAQGAFWGSKQYQQFDRWVGNQYPVGVAGVGPYALNDAIAGHIDDVLDIYADGVDRLMRRAFPDR